MSPGPKTQNDNKRNYTGVSVKLRATTCRARPGNTKRKRYCDTCINDLGWRKGMYWPAEEPTCKKGHSQYIGKVGRLYALRCKDRERRIK